MEDYEDDKDEDKQGVQDYEDDQDVRNPGFHLHTLTRTGRGWPAEEPWGGKTSHNFHNSHHLTIETWPEPRSG